MTGKPKRNRNINIHIRLNEDEYEVLQRRVMKSRLSQSEYIRSLITGKSISGYSEEFYNSRLGKIITKKGGD
jgi:hypothetical protein